MSGNPRARQPHHPIAAAAAAVAALPLVETGATEVGLSGDASPDTDQDSSSSEPPRPTRTFGEHVKFWLTCGRQCATVFGNVGRFLGRKDLVTAAQRTDEFCEDAVDAAPIIERMVVRRRR